jgi:hypothetical protein
MVGIYAIADMQDLFSHELAEIYDVEYSSHLGQETTV